MVVTGGESGRKGMKKTGWRLPFSGLRRIVFYYLVLGAAWAFCSDPLLKLLIDDPRLRELLHPFRDIFFFVLTGFFLYLVLERYLKVLRRGDRKLYHAAYHDSLTGLANQLRFQNLLEETLSELSGGDNKAAILLLDLDRFRTVVRTLGHSVGNRLLKEIARRLQSCLDPQALLSRFSGDEFAVLLPSIEHSDQVAGVAESLQKCLKEPFPFVEHGLHLSGSIGIAIYPHDGHDAITLLKNAEVARSRAKEMGGHGFQFYFPEMNEFFLQSLILENRLHTALERNELGVRYQPLLHLHRSRISGLEALICWRYPDGESISPERFIPLAEETGLIEPIGEWVLTRACRQNHHWQQRGLPPQRMAVNVSVRQFFQPGFFDMVCRVLENTGLAPKWLALELTESMLMQDVEQARKLLADLRHLGVKVVIDDFGTGYSSLSYLKRFPVDGLKIDQSFIEGIPRDHGDTALTAAIIAMGHALGLEVIAEGVERLEQYRFLKEKGCDRIQGYLFHPPLTADECTGLLMERRLESIVLN
ncbi:diguanylate cyclase [Geothermobacter hydrogeniphilus]|uniref:Diguanylate cyclase n=2 Tax=Geothermobacter hydrogeniphilus TaxID=1969733 RepID=A0A2K2H6Z2_9BACT|nr:diguanylate cyclase [Geothermobacter hydrogeniphilus]